MKLVLASLVVLAQRHAWESLGNRFSGDALRWRASDTLSVVLLVVGIGAGIWLLSRLGKWQEHLNRNDRPRSPFGELTRAHGLNRRERSLCREVATELELGEPAELFVRPDTGREAVARRDPALAKRLFS